MKSRLEELEAIERAAQAFVNATTDLPPGAFAAREFRALAESVFVVIPPSVRAAREQSLTCPCLEDE